MLGHLVSNGPTAPVRLLPHLGPWLKRLLARLAKR
jgi:hypothetical protein